MFDNTKLTDTVETITVKVDEAVNTAIATTEENTKKMVGYIQDHNVRTIAEAYTASSFAIARAVVDANKTMAEATKKALAI